MRYGSVKKVASLPRTADTCVKEEGGRSWKLSEIEHDFFEKRSPAPLWDYEPSFPPFPSRLFLRYIRREFRPPLYLTLLIPKFHWENIALKFIRKSWGAMRCFAIRLSLNLPNERPLHFSRASLNERFL